MMESACTMLQQKKDSHTTRGRVIRIMSLLCTISIVNQQCNEYEHYCKFFYILCYITEITERILAEVITANRENGKCEKINVHGNNLKNSRLPTWGE
jgi:hypothetical protein